MNMNILEFVTQQYIYNGCYNWKIFWEGKFTPGDFTPVNMKNCCRCNLRKHREIKTGEKYIALDISCKFGILDKMRHVSEAIQSV